MKRHSRTLVLAVSPVVSVSVTGGRVRRGRCDEITIKVPDRVEERHSGVETEKGSRFLKNVPGPGAVESSE